MLGQCYDGASAVSSAKNGVAKQISIDEPLATCIYIHCYGHALNLSVCDVNQCKVCNWRLKL